MILSLLKECFSSVKTCSFVIRILKFANLGKGWWHCFQTSPFFCLVDPFVPNAPFLYPLKTENRKVFWCIQRVEKGCIGSELVNGEAFRDDDCMVTVGWKIFPSYHSYSFLSEIQYVKKHLDKGPSKICGRQSSANFAWDIFEYFVPFLAFIDEIFAL